MPGTGTGSFTLPTKGRTKRTAYKLNVFLLVPLTTRPEIARLISGLTASGGIGAVGTSSETRQARARDLRDATNAPPALTFRVTVKSRNSFPFLSTPRKKRGIAKGNLSKRLRSLRIVHLSPGGAADLQSKHCASLWPKGCIAETDHFLIFPLFISALQMVPTASFVVEDCLSTKVAILLPRVNRFCFPCLDKGRPPMINMFFNS